MQALDSIVNGFAIALQPLNIVYCFAGVVIGTFTGVLPGFGPTAAIALLIPVTYTLPPVSAIILLSGIYYGSMYGGSTTSILVNIPGESASVVTCLEGYPLAKQGRAGPALGISAFGSLIGGSISIIGLMLMAPPVAEFALRFGPHEFFSLMLLGLTIVTYVAHGSVLKALMMAALGLVLGSVGLDTVSGAPRLTLATKYLLDGIPLVPLAMGLFGISEILQNVERTVQVEVYEKKVRNLLPSRSDWRASIWPIIRGTGVGFFLGLIPGAGPVIASFSSYAMERKLSKYPERYGTGVIEGVAGPETANNASAQSAFIPLLTLGIPPTPALAILFAAFVMHGIQPGPMLIPNNPNLFWGVVASMYIGNIMLVILNLPMIGVWVRIVLIPYVYLVPSILLFCLIGAFSIRFSILDIYTMLLFGVVGYVMKKFRYEGAPMILAFILGPLMETSLRRSLIIARGSFIPFLTKPICVIGFVVTAVMLLANISSFLRARRPAVGVEG